VSGVAAGQPQAGLPELVVPPFQGVAQRIGVEAKAGVEVRHRDGDGVDLLEQRSLLSHPLTYFK
jgi:hypothetical protein